MQDRAAEISGNGLTVQSSGSFHLLLLNDFSLVPWRTWCFQRIKRVGEEQRFKELCGGSRGWHGKAVRGFQLGIHLCLWFHLQKKVWQHQFLLLEAEWINALQQCCGAEHKRNFVASLPLIFFCILVNTEPFPIDKTELLCLNKVTTVQKTNTLYKTQI